MKTAEQSNSFILIYSFIFHIGIASNSTPYEYE